MMPTCYQLVGVPGSGKTSWAFNQQWFNNCVYISTDYFIEKFACRMGKTYSQVFNTVITRAVRLMMRRVRRAQMQQLDIIWDQTNITAESRSRKFHVLSDYEHIAVVFETPELNELDSRLGSRPGKIIPWEVLDYMLNGFTMPTTEEGFKQIWRT